MGRDARGPGQPARCVFHLKTNQQNLTAPTRMNLAQLYNLGYRDGLNGNYDPPGTVWSSKKRELDERRSYKHGYEAGKKERSRRR